MLPTIPAGLPPIQSEILRDGGVSATNSPSQGKEFSNVLEGLVASANVSARAADGLAQAFAAGARDDIHGTMIAISKADIELHLVGTVRNKVIDAFYELWRMQI
jgi:flagellar hook-basal body complex protein FliE